ncbi:MAG: alanine racemase [Ilumatobacteraceae bacterium]|nr:alanine racemase [Ilumatobacteraceae bacterium]
MSTSTTRWAWVEVDTDAVCNNVAHLCSLMAPSEVWVVVKADGYGHGALRVARAAIDGGATGLCVALVEEGARLREAGVEVPVLILSEQPPSQSADIVRHGLTATIASRAGLMSLNSAAAAHGVVAAVHVKVDTGMHRAGVDPKDAINLVTAVHEADNLALAGVFTHFACADEPDHEANARQLATFNRVIDDIRATRINPGRVHAANSAAALTMSTARLDMVRVGIVTYGLVPGSGVASYCGEFRPALAVKAQVSAVRTIEAGDAVSYGLRRAVSRTSTIATVPVGYADGVPRGLWATAQEVLLRGQRCPIAGTVTMDQLMIDVTECGGVQVGDVVTLIGADGNDAVTVSEWATSVGTIDYEIVCGMSARMERRYL